MKRLLRQAAILAMLAGLSHSLTVNGYEVDTYFWSDGQVDVHVDLAASNPPGANAPNVVAGGPSTAQLQSAYLEAMSLWNTYSTFNYTSTINSGSSDPCVVPSSDPRNGVVFADASCGSAFGGATLAVQQTWFSGTSSTKTGTVFNNTKQWDLYSGNWTGVAEFKRVAVHELGHGLGLNHSSVSGAIMRATVGNTKIPQADDIAGAAALYDSDADGVGLFQDNCPDVANSSQSDVDGDNQGDECDADADGDGVFDTAGVAAAHGLDNLSSSFFSFGPDSGSSAAYRAMTFPISFAASLTTIQLPISCPIGDLSLSIQTLDVQGRPSGVILASQQFATGNGIPSTYSGPVDFVFTNPASITGGTSVAVVAQAASSCLWFISSGGDYALGDGYFSVDGSNWFGTSDFPFAAVVDPSVADNCPLIVNANQNDLDLDGLGDLCDPDQDDDGLSNLDEINVHMTDPLKWDTDGDTYSDGDEVNAGSDPLEENSVPGMADGDINGDGQLTLADVLLGQKFLLKVLVPTAAELQRGDVAPLVGGVPQPDGQFEIGDLLLILQKTNGQINF